ncbi:hypothetical protein M501DRAFT_1028931 [Patellaria atrata CBS 101060]|uniref:Zinc finger PHD-type domain-containing protein n=1 Tax=Patellaria atrata CBS 101060 TaxID=1346257 RepID=A0A9P4SGC1_9PEZI|nr:hypothetical protein M501DRAFT_1028931 [Patellaria atrata CBS 101060]
MSSPPEHKSPATDFKMAPIDGATLLGPSQTSDVKVFPNDTSEFHQVQTPRSFDTDAGINDTLRRMSEPDYILNSPRSIHRPPTLDEMAKVTGLEKGEAAERLHHLRPSKWYRRGIKVDGPESSQREVAEKVEEGEIDESKYEASTESGIQQSLPSDETPDAVKATHIPKVQFSTEQGSRLGKRKAEDDTSDSNSASEPDSMPTTTPPPSQKRTKITSTMTAKAPRRATTSVFQPPVHAPPKRTARARTRKLTQDSLELATQTRAAKKAPTRSMQKASNYSCDCGKPDEVEDMIMCESGRHGRDCWWHLSCAGFGGGRSVPEGEWVCEGCEGSGEGREVVVALSESLDWRIIASLTCLSVVYIPAWFPFPGYDIIPLFLPPF